MALALSGSLLFICSWVDKTRPNAIMHCTFCFSGFHPNCIRSMIPNLWWMLLVCLWFNRVSTLPHPLSSSAMSQLLHIAGLTKISSHHISTAAPQASILCSKSWGNKETRWERLITQITAKPNCVPEVVLSVEPNSVSLVSLTTAFVVDGTPFILSFWRDWLHCMCMRVSECV